MNRPALLPAAALIAAAIAGCANSRTSNTSRTAIEQMLISNAVDQSLDKVDFTPFSGAKVYLQEKYVDCQDKNYVIASVRHRLLAQGALLVDDAAEADIGVELRTGGVGTDMAESFIGTPELVLPGMLTLPEVKLLTKNEQTATAKIGLVAYDYRSRQVLGSGGLTTAVSDNSNWSVLGVGPFQAGSLKAEMARSTTGRNRSVKPQLPSRVAFDAPAADIQYAGGQKRGDVEPAKAEIPDGAGSEVTPVGDLWPN